MAQRGSTRFELRNGRFDVNPVREAYNISIHGALMGEAGATWAVVLREDDQVHLQMGGEADYRRLHFAWIPTSTCLLVEKRKPSEWEGRRG